MKMLVLFTFMLSIFITTNTYAKLLNKIDMNIHIGSVIDDLENVEVKNNTQSLGIEGINSNEYCDFSDWELINRALDIVAVTGEKFRKELRAKIRAGQGLCFKDALPEIGIPEYEYHNFKFVFSTKIFKLSNTIIYSGEDIDSPKLITGINVERQKK